MSAIEKHHDHGHHGHHGKGEKKDKKNAPARVCTLLLSEYVTPETKLMRFSLAPDEVLSKEVEAVISLRATLANGEVADRHYSPVSPTSQRGSFDVLVKLFRPNGMSAHLHAMRVGDTIELMGPRVKYHVTANQYKRVGIVAGGVGITSVFQVAQELLTHPEDRTEVSLLHVARHETDLVLRARIEELKKLSNGRLKVDHILSRPGEAWQGLRGHVTADLLKKLMPPPAEGTMILVCGPDSLEEAVCGKSFHGRPLEKVSGMLNELGYTVDMVHCF